MSKRIALAAGLSLLSIPAFAAPTSTWDVDSYEDFNKGEAKSVLITSAGEIKPGWSAKNIKSEITSAWSMLRAKNGTLYVGTADKAGVFKVKGDKVTRWASLKGELAVVSLAEGKDGTIYAGTMPGASIWKIPANGQASKLVKLPGAETVWGLAVDAKKGQIYAGTGPDGKLFRVDPKSGKASVAFKAKDKRIQSLMAARDGSIWFGTSEKAMVFRHTPSNKRTRAMGDFSGNEITAIAEWKGAAIVAANDISEPSTAGAKTKSAVDKSKSKAKPGVKIKTAKTGSKPGAEKSNADGIKIPRKGARKGKGAIFRVRGDGQLTQLHSLSNTFYTSLAVSPDNKIFAGAGDKGRIYMVDEDDAVSTVVDVDQRIIAAMVYMPKQGLRFATADASALYRTERTPKASQYLSKAFDAKSSAKYGKLSWRSKGTASIETRTGNVAEPGQGWSIWQTPKNVRRGGGGTMRGSVASPAGRYIQYRVRFPKASGEVSETRLYYLPQNRATRIKSVTLPGMERKGKLTTTKSGASKPRSPVLKLKWAVDNPDKDETVYTLRVRREGEARWRKLSTGKPLTKAEFSWNTETFADGYYRLRVTASDASANPGNQALETHKTTAPFLVDNQKPRIEGLNVRFPAVSARAVDSLSAIAEAAYSIDDGPWHVVGTVDGLFDDQTELLKLTIKDKDLSKGIHTLAIRVADEAGNIGSASVTFKK